MLFRFIRFPYFLFERFSAIGAEVAGFLDEPALVGGFLFCGFLVGEDVAPVHFEGRVAAVAMELVDGDGVGDNHNRPSSIIPNGSPSANA